MPRNRRQLRVFGRGERWRSSQGLSVDGKLQTLPSGFRTIHCRVTLCTHRAIPAAAPHESFFLLRRYLERATPLILPVEQRLRLRSTPRPRRDGCCRGGGPEEAERIIFSVLAPPSVTGSAPGWGEADRDVSLLGRRKRRDHVVGHHALVARLHGEQGQAGCHRLPFASARLPSRTHPFARVGPRHT